MKRRKNLKTAKPEIQLPKISFTIPEACEVIGIGTDKLYKLIRAGTLRSYTIGSKQNRHGTVAGRRMVSLSAIQEFIADRERDTKSAA